MVDLEFVGDYRQPRLTARQRELGFDGQSDGDFTFDDFLDIINPLQHIPVISTLYREITGDQIGAPARIFGGVLFGGPSGFIAAAVSSLYEEIAGEDIGQTVLALFSGDSEAEPQFAEGDSPMAPATAGDLDAQLGPPLMTAAGAEDPAAAPARPAFFAPLGAPIEPPTGPLPSAASPGMGSAGTGGAGMLTGQDALSALFRDLGGGARPAPAAAAATPLPQRPAEAARSIPLPPRMVHVGPAGPQGAVPPPQAPGLTGSEVTAAGEAAAAHPLIFAQDVPEAAVAERMKEALDKYRAMSRARQPEPKSDAIQWRSDPALPDGDS